MDHVLSACQSITWASAISFYRQPSEQIPTSQSIFIHLDLECLLSIYASRHQCIRTALVNMSPTVDGRVERSGHQQIGLKELQPVGCAGEVAQELRIKDKRPHPA